MKNLKVQEYFNEGYLDLRVDDGYLDSPIHQAQDGYLD